MTISVGFVLPQYGNVSSAASLRTLGHLADDLGFESIWVSDHIVAPLNVRSKYPYAPGKQFAGDPFRDRIEPFVALSYMAACTSRVRLGFSVLVLPYRHPAQTAKMLASLDVLSGGRVSAGVGTGWMAEEFDALGVPFDERGGRVDECLQICRSLWTGEPVQFAGTFYRLDDIVCRPVPVQPGGPPISIGGHSTAAYRRIGRHADVGYHIVVDSAATTYGRHLELEQNIEAMRAEVASSGRDPSTVEITATVLSGTLADVITDLDRYERSDVRRLILGFPASAAATLSEMERSLTAIARELSLSNRAVEKRT